MSHSSDARISVPSSVMLRDVGGESVILNLDTGRYFGLDEVGARMLAVLLGSESIQAAREALLAEYEVDADVLRRDVEDLIHALVEHGLLEVRGG